MHMGFQILLSVSFVLITTVVAAQAPPATEPQVPPNASETNASEAAPSSAPTFSMTNTEAAPSPSPAPQPATSSEPSFSQSPAATETATSPTPTASSNESPHNPQQPAVTLTAPSVYPHSTGLGGVITGSILLGVGGLNLLTSPICVSGMVDPSLETTCLAASIGFGATLVAIGIPLLVVGKKRRNAYKEWQQSQQAWLNFDFFATKKSAGIGWHYHF